MTGPTAPPPPAPWPAARPAVSTAAVQRPLLGMYVLVLTVLCCVAACAGQIFFQGDLGLSAGRSGAINRCGVSFPLIGTASPNLAGFDRCAAGAMRFEGLVILGVIAAVLVAALALSILVPWVELRQLARAVPVADIPGVTARFGELSAEAGLGGRRRPRLHVAGPGRPVIRQAFTTAQPWGRPLIVLPGKLALERQDPGRFDPVVLHELAHVRARDVSWVSSVRGITWLTIPVIVLACVPGFAYHQGGRIAGPVLVQAGLFAVIATVFATGLLRLRELEADRQAAQWMGSPAALDRILNTEVTRSGAGRRTFAGWLLKPLERHPSAAARSTALRSALGTSGTDLTYPLAVGVVAALAMNTAYYLTWTIDFAGGQWPAVRASAGVGSVLLGAGLTPGLIRRAVAARRAGTPVSWWRPVAGTAAGLLLGLLVPPSTLPNPALTLASGGSLAHTAIKVILTVAAGAGIAALAAGIASLAAAGEPHRRGRWLTAWVTVAVSCSAAAALWPILSSATGEVERSFLALALPVLQWRWLALPYVATAFLLSARLRLQRVSSPEAATAVGRGPTARRPSRPGRRARLALAPVAIPACAAIVGTALLLPHSLVRPGMSAAVASQVVVERWWACTLIGWVVLAVLALAWGVPGLARAWVSAWLATLLAGAGLVSYGMVHGHRPDSAVLSLVFARPSVWLFYLGVPTACLALRPGRPYAALRLRWALPASVTAAAAAVLVVIGLAAPLDSLTFGPPAPVSVAGAGSDRPLPSANPGRVLTAAAARRVIDDVGAALTPTWTGRSTITTGSAAPKPTAPKPTATQAAPVTAVSPGACGPLAREAFISDLPAALLHAAGQYQAAAGVIPIGSATLTVLIESYGRPVPAAMFAAAGQDLHGCHAFSVTGLGGTSAWTVREAPALHLRLRVPFWQADFSIVYKNVRASSAWIFVGVGHNLIAVTQQTSAVGASLPLQQAAITTALNAAMSGLSHAPAQPAA